MLGKRLIRQLSWVTRQGICESVDFQGFAPRRLPRDDAHARFCDAKARSDELHQYAVRRTIHWWCCQPYLHTTIVNTRHLGSRSARLNMNLEAGRAAHGCIKQP